MDGDQDVETGIPIDDRSSTDTPEQPEGQCARVAEVARAITAVSPCAALAAAMPALVLGSGAVGQPAPLVGLRRACRRCWASSGLAARVRQPQLLGLGVAGRRSSSSVVATPRRQLGAVKVGGAGRLSGSQPASVCQPYTAGQGI